MTLENRIRKLEQMLYESFLHTENAITTERKQSQRVEVQDEGLMTFHTAMCVSTIDPLKQGRIRIYSPLLCDKDTPLNALPFASPISPFPGFDDSGAPWVPPAGTTVAIMFHNGNRNAPYYFGSIWTRHRGPDGQHMEFWDYGIKEYECLWDKRRNGYLVGRDDGDQNLPPWNTESYNGYDNDDLNNFYNDPSQFGSITYSNIRGMKTPEKLGIKFVDGDPKCNNRWKRLEIFSNGNGILMKDDHLHPSGQWAFGQGNQNINYCHTVDVNDPSKEAPKEWPCCGPNKTPQPCQTQTCDTVDTPDGCGPTNNQDTDSSVDRKTVMANPFFKRREEQKFYEGVNTPMKNKYDLDQSGMQFITSSGQEIILDDSVDQPTGVPTWNREFDFGCNDTFKGKIIIRSATGHEEVIDDSEDERKNRGSNNGIRFTTAWGNYLKGSDHTIKQGDECECPPNIAGEDRGWEMGTTSTHLFKMCDKGLHQCGEPRKNGGVPRKQDKNTFEGYVLLRSGYGLQLLMKDQDIQTETKDQFIQLLAPQTDNTERGPHMLVMQEAPEEKGLVLLRAGGIYYVESYDESIEVVGVDEVNPANKITQVSDNYLIDTKGYFFSLADHQILVANKYAFLIAGQDCEVDDPDASAQTAQDMSNADIAQAIASGQGVKTGRNQDGTPCIRQAIVAQDPWPCPFTGFVHFGVMEDQNKIVLDARSNRVFLSSESENNTSKSNSSGGGSGGSGLGPTTAPPTSPGDSPQARGTAG